MDNGGTNTPIRLWELDFTKIAWKNNWGETKLSYAGYALYDPKTNEMDKWINAIRSEIAVDYTVCPTR